MRIVTRPDFDGIVCAVLLYAAEDIDSDIFWVEPSEIQSGQTSVQKGDIIANLPFDPQCSLWFDHHVSNKPDKAFNGAFDIAPSAARVVYEYYKNLGKLDSRFDELIEHTDMIDSADLTMDQVRFPENYPYIILAMTIQNQRYKDRAYWDRLVSMLTTLTMETLMEDTEVQIRCKAVVQENQEYSKFLTAHTTFQDKISITDFRSLDTVPGGNRFLTYSLFPHTIASVKIRYNSPEKTQVLVSIGHSIFNQGCQVNVGRLLAKFGGGGHAGAGGCSLDAETAQKKLDLILKIMAANQKEA